MAFDVVELLAEIEGIGRDELRGGWSRHVFDEAEIALRDWFLEKAAALGLRVEIDRNANIWATWNPAESTEAAIAIGSHLDSVPGGGQYDGPLGVASALEVVDRLQREGATLRRPVTIAVFAEEEGSRFGIACLGSKLTAGALSAERARELTDATGKSFAQVVLAAGIDPAGLGADPERIARIAAFVELHVEQGRGLVDLGAPVAVASAILAHGRWRLSFLGEGNHAGATAMADRRDPVAALAEAVLAAQRIAAAHDDPGRDHHGRATIGRIIPIPGGTNVVASRVDAWLDVRGDDDAGTRALLSEILDGVRQGAQQQGCTVEIVEESYGSRVVFDEELRDRIVDTLGGAPVLSTGAGHDAGVLGEVLPTAMLFVRNPTGVSHSPFEIASDEDCRAGAVALLAVVKELAG